MKWLWCLVVGHQKIRVSPTNVIVRTTLGGIIDYRPDKKGKYTACARCGKVLGPNVFP